MFRTSLDVPIPYDQKMYFGYEVLIIRRTQISIHFLNADFCMIFFDLLKSPSINFLIAT